MSESQKYQAELAAKSSEIARLQQELGAVKARLRALEATVSQGPATVDDSAAQLRAIRDNLVVGILNFDGDGTIEELNSVAERMFGYGPGELLGKSVRTILADSPRHPMESYLLWLTGGGEANGDESGLGWHAASASSRVTNLIGRGKDGSTFPVQVGVTEVKGGSRRFTAVIHNLTKKWRLEQDLRQAQKLQIVGRLVSSITHDFNNLLMGVGGCIDIARTKLDATHPALRFLDEAKRAMATRIPLARPLLMFIRQEETRFVSRAVDAVIEYNKEMLRRLLGSDIELRIRLAAPEAKVLGPEGALEEILMNLSANARDAMTQGGRLQIETQVLPGDYLLLQVSGHRTSTEIVEGDYYQELLHTPKEVKQRTALSLATVYSILKQSAGHLALGFDRESGLTLSILLPLAREKGAAAQVEQRPMVSPSTEESVLVVAAPDEQRLAWRKSLTRMGYRVVEADDSATALALCRQAEQRMDLLILDLDSSPKGHAGRLEAEISALNPDLMTVYLTQDSAESLIQLGRMAPGMIVLKKPLNEITLRAALVLALGVRALLLEHPEGEAAPSP